MIKIKAREVLSGDVLTGFLPDYRARHLVLEMSIQGNDVTIVTDGGRRFHKHQSDVIQLEGEV